MINLTTKLGAISGNIHYSINLTDTMLKITSYLLEGLKDARRKNLISLGMKRLKE